jgi:hypothetical protein
MPLLADSAYTTDADSAAAGRSCGRAALAGLAAAPQLMVTYLTVNHDQPAFLRGLREAVGPDCVILGCSTQGVVARGVVREEGYAAGVMGLRGEGAHVAGARVTDIHVDSAAKGAALGQALLARLPERPKIAVLHYDPVCGADMDLFLGGLEAVLGCPIVGGAAGHFHGPTQTTFQYFGEEITSRSAVALALAGDFTPEIGCTSGAAAVGIEMTVTRAEGTLLLELDGRPALEVWQEVTGAGAPSAEHSAALALGVPVRGATAIGAYLTRGSFGVDAPRGGVVVQAAIPEGTRVMLQHRTVDDILEGARAMGADLQRRVRGRRVRAAFGFECGARTVPFLGLDATQRENHELQQTAAPDAAWLGMLAWGEVFPVDGRPGFHNYTYPVLLIVD